MNTALKFMCPVNHSTRLLRQPCVAHPLLLALPEDVQRAWQSLAEPGSPCPAAACCSCSRGAQERFGEPFPPGRFDLNSVSCFRCACRLLIALPRWVFRNRCSVGRAAGAFVSNNAPWTPSSSPAMLQS